MESCEFGGSGADLVDFAPTPEENKCLGFEEDLVLSVKDCFLEGDLRKILMVKCGPGVRFYSRGCSREVEGSVGVCLGCGEWFAQLCNKGGQDRNLSQNLISDPLHETRLNLGLKTKVVTEKLIPRGDLTCDKVKCSKVFQNNRLRLKHLKHHEREKLKQMEEQEEQEKHTEQEVWMKDELLQQEGEGRTRCRKYSEDRWAFYIYRFMVLNLKLLGPMPDNISAGSKTVRRPLNTRKFT